MFAIIQFKKKCFQVKLNIIVLTKKADFTKTIGTNCIDTNTYCEYIVAVRTFFLVIHKRNKTLKLSNKTHTEPTLFTASVKRNKLRHSWKRVFKFTAANFFVAFPSKRNHDLYCFSTVCRCFAAL